MSRPSPRSSPLIVAVTLCLLSALLAALPVSSSQAAGKRKSTARWDVSSYVVGTDQLQVHGRVPGGKRKVQLQVKNKGGWQTLRTRRSKGNGTYALKARLDWLGTHKARVFAPGRPAFSKSKKITVSPGYAPTGRARDYALLGGSIARTPRFNPCSPITYRVNSDQVGPTGLAAVQLATAQISQATGIRFKYRGTTSYIPFNDPKKRPPANADLFISWNTTAESQAFQGREASVAGIGGPLWVYPARDARGRRANQTKKAGLVLKTESYNANFTGALESSDTSRPPAGRLLLHEIGHAMGLAHSPAAEEVMYFTQWNPDPDGVLRARYSAGDLKGMSKVGYDQACLRPLRGGRIAPIQLPAPQE